MLALTLTADLTGYEANSEVIHHTLAHIILNRVTELRPNDTQEDPYFYTFKVQCTSCRETHPNWVNVNRFVSGAHKIITIKG